VRVRSVGALIGVLASLLVAGTASAPSAEAAGPSVAVWPRTDLVDDQPLLLTLRNWEPNAFLAAWLCPATAAAWSTNCDYVTRLTPGPRGNLRVRRPADVIVDRRRGGPVDCRVSACELRVQDVNDQRGLVRVPVSFDPAGPDPVRPPMTVR
jgi:hypothetical protein